MAEKSLYERLGGIFAIAAVVDYFSDALLKNPKIVNANPELKKWHTETYRQRLPGLKFLRTLWSASVAGGPFKYTGEALRDAHFDLHITPEVFDEVILVELANALDREVRARAADPVAHEFKSAILGAPACKCRNPEGYGFGRPRKGNWGRRSSCGLRESEVTSP